MHVLLPDPYHTHGYTQNLIILTVVQPCGDLHFIPCMFNLDHMDPGNSIEELKTYKSSQLESQNCMVANGGGETNSRAKRRSEVINLNNIMNEIMKTPHVSTDNVSEQHTQQVYSVYYYRYYFVIKLHGGRTAVCNRHSIPRVNHYSNLVTFYHTFNSDALQCCVNLKVISEANATDIDDGTPVATQYTLATSKDWTSGNYYFYNIQTVSHACM